MTFARQSLRASLSGSTIFSGQAIGILAAAFAFTTPHAAHAQLVERSGEISGRIVAKKTGEEARLVPARNYRNAAVRQRLKAGDVLRTNANGTLALLFADRTQVRLGRNSTMTVNAVRRGGASSVDLRGKAWGRSPRKKSQMRVRTPNATAAIRGTEWYLDANDQFTLLEVFEGTVVLETAYGSITVQAGQAAIAEAGKAPVLIDISGPDGRARLAELGGFNDDPAALAALQEARRKFAEGDRDGANEAAYDASTTRPYDPEVLILLVETSYREDGSDVANQQLDALDRIGAPSGPARATLALQEFDWGRAIDALLGQQANGAPAVYAANLRDGSLYAQSFRGLGLDAWGRYHSDRAFDPRGGVGYADRNITRRETPFAPGVNTNRLPGEFESSSSSKDDDYYPYDPNRLNSASLSRSVSGSTSLPGGSAGLSPYGGGRIDDDALTNLVMGAVRDPLRVAGVQTDLVLGKRSRGEGFVGTQSAFGSDFTGWSFTGGIDAVRVGTPVPVAVSGRFSYQRSDRDDGLYDSLAPALPAEAEATRFNGELQLGLELSGSDRVFAFASHSSEDGDLWFDNTGGVLPRTAEVFRAGSVDLRETRAGLFWNHAFGESTQLTAGGLYSQIALQRTEEEPIPTPYAFNQINESDYTALVAQLSHGTGPVTLRGGLDVSWDTGTFELSDLQFGFASNQSFGSELRRIEPYADIYVDLGAVRLQGQISYWDIEIMPRPSRFDINPAPFVAQNDGFDFKVGAAFAPSEGQWLRAAVIRETANGQGFGLMPTHAVGLTAMATPSIGETTNYIARWDGQWSNTFFTSLSFDRQDSDGLLYFSPSGLGLINLGQARIDRFSGEANIRLDRNAGLSLSYRHNDSQSQGFGSISYATTATALNPGDRVPYVPTDEASATFNYALPAPARARFTAAVRYIGEQTGLLGTTLNDYVSVDLGASAELLDRRLLVEAGVTNLLDEQIEGNGYMPSGRVFHIGATFRF